MTDYMIRFAGHCFDPLTNVCMMEKPISEKYPAGFCGARRTHVHMATSKDVGVNPSDVHFACVDPLNNPELGEIQADEKVFNAERDRAYDAIAYSVEH